MLTLIILLRFCAVELVQTTLLVLDVDASVNIETNLNRLSRDEENLRATASSPATAFVNVFALHRLLLELVLGLVRCEKRNDVDPQPIVDKVAPEEDCAVPSGNEVFGVLFSHRQHLLVDVIARFLST